MRPLMVTGKRSAAVLLALAALCVLAAQVRAGIMTKTIDLVLGQQDFLSNSSGCDAGKMNQPGSVAFDRQQGRVYVCDYLNNRVLWWNDYRSLANGAAADGVIGQAGMDENFPAGSRAGLNAPRSVAVDAQGNVWVADTGNKRVLKFARPSNYGEDALLVLGQKDFYSAESTCTAQGVAGPRGVAVDAAGNVWVADMYNNRVLRYTSPSENGQAADLVLGQPDLTTSDRGCTAGTLFLPMGVAVDAQGNVWVVDNQNWRVLKFRDPSSFGSQPAVRVLGQPDFETRAANNNGETTTGLQAPRGVAVDGDGNVWVADGGNCCVLRYPASSNNGLADIVVGPVMNDDAMMALTSPEGVAVDEAGNVWVMDIANNRVLKFNTLSVTSVSADFATVPCSQVSVSIFGREFVDNCAAVLAKPGDGRVRATAVTVVSPTRIDCTFDLTGKTTGYWDLSVSTSVYSILRGGFWLLPPPAIVSVTPNVASNTGVFTVTDLSGQGFPRSSKVRLHANGMSDIIASSVTVIDADHISCAFDLAGKAQGTWDVVVSTGGTGALSATLAGGVQIKGQGVTLGRDSDATLIAHLFTGDVEIYVPQGAFGRSVTLSVAPATPPSSGLSTVTPTVVGLSITGNGGAQPSRRITVTVHYTDEAAAGLDESKLLLARYDEAHGRWVPLPSVAWPAENKVTGTTDHLSTFAIVQLAPARDLAAVNVYPNPFNPKKGQFFFENLTVDAEVKLYTVAGELVRTLNPSATGRIAWDGKNDGGSTVASGVYIARIKSSSGDKKIKIAVQR